MVLELSLTVSVLLGLSPRVQNLDLGLRKIVTHTSVDIMCNMLVLLAMKIHYNSHYSLTETRKLPRCGLAYSDNWRRAGVGSCIII